MNSGQNWTEMYLVSSYKKGNEKIIKEKKTEVGIGYPENSCHCGYGLKWGEHYPDLLNPDIYKSYIRESCIVCGNFLPNTIEYYEKQGNFCGECNRKVMINVQKRSEDLKIEKKKTDKDDKIEELKKEL